LKAGAKGYTDYPVLAAVPQPAWSAYDLGTDMSGAADRPPRSIPKPNDSYDWAHGLHAFAWRVGRVTARK
jgi:hypothetical protein